MKGVYLGDTVRCKKQKRIGKVVGIDATLTIRVKSPVGGEFESRFEDLEVIAPGPDRKKYREGAR